MGKLVEVISNILIFARMQFVQMRLLPKFTTKGFEVIQTPPNVARLLRNALSEALTHWEDLPLEETYDIYNIFNLRPKFVSIPNLANFVHTELRSIHEAWAGISLKPTSVYGVRMYQNGSSLVMHLDKVKSGELQMISISQRHM